MSEGRRYFNLFGVVRDLEHASGPESTAEGRDLLDRWRDKVIEATEVAAALDADDESEDEDESDDLDGDVVGHGQSRAGRQHAGGPGSNDASHDELLSRLARMESALAALQGPQSPVPSGAPPVDGASGGATLLTRHRLVTGNTVSGEIIRDAETKGPAKRRKTSKRKR